MVTIYSDVSKKVIENARFGKNYSTILGKNLTMEEIEILDARVRKIMEGKSSYTLKDRNTVFTTELMKICK